MNIKEIVEGMTAPQVAQVIKDNFNEVDKDKANKTDLNKSISDLASVVEANKTDLTKKIDNNKEDTDEKLSELRPKAVIYVKGIYNGKQAAINDGLNTGDNFIYYSLSEILLATFLSENLVSYKTITEDGIYTIDGLLVKLINNDLKIVGLSGIITLDGISTYPEINGTFGHYNGSVYYRFKNTTSNWGKKYLPISDAQISRYVYRNNYYELNNGTLKRVIDILIQQSVRLEDFTPSKYWDFDGEQPALKNSNISNNCALIEPIVIEEGQRIVINSGTQNKNISIAGIVDENGKILSRYISAYDGKTIFIYAPKGAKYLYVNSNVLYSNFICTINPPIIKDILQNNNYGNVLENFQLKKYWNISKGENVEIKESSIQVNACSRNPIPINYGDVVFAKGSTENKNLPILGISDDSGKIIKIYNSKFDGKQIVFVAPKESSFLYMNCKLGYNDFQLEINPPLLSEYIRTQEIESTFDKKVDFGEPTNDLYKGLQSDYSFGAKETRTSEIYTMFDNLVDEKYLTKSSIGMASDNSEMFAYTFKPRLVSMTEDLSEGSKTNLKIIIVCGQHGIEKSSIYGTYYFLKDLLYNYKESDFLQYVRSNINLVIIPCANPYGIDNLNYLNANGVNLNRNWPIKNWSKNDKTAWDDQYGGESAGDQIEVKNISNLLSENSDALLVIDFHTNGSGIISEKIKINWISYLVPEDDYFKRIINASKNHIKKITEYFEEEYSLLLGNSESMCGYITGTIGNEGFVGYLDCYSKEQGFLSLTFEGFNGFPNESSAYSELTKKANSELLGSFIRSICLEYNRIL